MNSQQDNLALLFSCWLLGQVEVWVETSVWWSALMSTTGYMLNRNLPEGSCSLCQPSCLALPASSSLSCPSCWHPLRVGIILHLQQTHHLELDHHLVMNFHCHRDHFLSA